MRMSEEAHSRHTEQRVQTRALGQERAGLVLGTERWPGRPNVIGEEEAGVECGWSGPQIPELAGPWKALGRNLSFILRAVGSHWCVLGRGGGKMDVIRSASLQHSPGSCMNHICEGEQRGGEEPLRRLLHLSIGAKQCWMVVVGESGLVQNYLVRSSIHL